MQVARPRRAGVSLDAQRIAASDRLPGNDHDRGEVGVLGEQATRVLYAHDVAETEIAGLIGRRVVEVRRRTITPAEGDAVGCRHHQVRRLERRRRKIQREPTVVAASRMGIAAWLQRTLDAKDPITRGNRQRESDLGRHSRQRSADPGRRATTVVRIEGGATELAGTATARRPDGAGRGDGHQPEKEVHFGARTLFAAHASAPRGERDQRDPLTLALSKRPGEGSRRSLAVRPPRTPASARHRRPRILRSTIASIEARQPPQREPAPQAAVTAAGVAAPSRTH